MTITFPEDYVDLRIFLKSPRGKLDAYLNHKGEVPRKDFRQWGYKNTPEPETLALLREVREEAHRRRALPQPSRAVNPRDWSRPSLPFRGKRAQRKPSPWNTMPRHSPSVPREYRAPCTNPHHRHTERGERCPGNYRDWRGQLTQDAVFTPQKRGERSLSPLDEAGASAPRATRRHEAPEASPPASARAKSPTSSSGESPLSSFEDVCHILGTEDKDTTQASKTMPSALKNPNAPANYNIVEDFYKKLKPEFRDHAFILDEADKYVHHIGEAEFVDNYFDENGKMKELSYEEWAHLDKPIPGSTLRRGLLHDPKALAKVLKEPLDHPPPPQGENTPWPMPPPSNPEGGIGAEKYGTPQGSRPRPPSPIPSPEYKKDSSSEDEFSNSEEEQKDREEGEEDCYIVDVDPKGPSSHPGTPKAHSTPQETLQDSSIKKTPKYRVRDTGTSSFELECDTSEEEDTPPLSPRILTVHAPDDTYQGYVAASTKVGLIPVGQEMWELMERARPGIHRPRKLNRADTTPPPTVHESTTVRADPVHHPETADNPEEDPSPFKVPALPPKLRARAQRPTSLPDKPRSRSMGSMGFISKDPPCPLDLAVSARSGPPSLENVSSQGSSLSSLSSLEDGGEDPAPKSTAEPAATGSPPQGQKPKGGWAKKKNFLGLKVKIPKVDDPKLGIMAPKATSLTIKKRGLDCSPLFKLRKTPSPPRKRAEESQEEEEDEGEDNPAAPKRKSEKKE